MSGQHSNGIDSACDVEELLQIKARCRELKKEKDSLRESQFESYELVRVKQSLQFKGSKLSFHFSHWTMKEGIDVDNQNKLLVKLNEESIKEFTVGLRLKQLLELHVKTLSEARIDDKKRIQELERELNNCSQEIDYLQDQLNDRNMEVDSLGEHVRTLELQLADMELLEETFRRVSEELKASRLECLFLIQELEKKDLELQESTLCIEKLEESLSSTALEYEFEMENLKLDLMAMEESVLQAKRLQEERAQEKTKMCESIQDFELKIQDAENVIEFLNKENKELKEKLETYERNARVFSRKVEKEFHLTLEKQESESLSNEPNDYVSSCGDILGPLLSKLVVVGASDADVKDKVRRSSEIQEYEQLVKQLKEELKEEKLKAKEEAEDLAQEMAELRYQLTGLLEEERKRRAYVEQISLQRVAELEAQIGSEQRKSITVVRRGHTV